MTFSTTALVFWLTAAWTTVVSNADFTVERRPFGSDGLFEVRVTAHANVTPEQMFKVIWGHGEYEQFVPHLKKLKIMSDNGTEKLVYQQIKMPVVKDRDYTVRIKKTVDEKTRVYESDFETDNLAGMPEDGDHVRVAMIKGRWTLSPDDEGKGTDVVYQLYSDPGKELPLWIVNMAQKAAAPDLVKAMISRAEKRSSAK